MNEKKSGRWVVAHPSLDHAKEPRLMTDAEDTRSRFGLLAASGGYVMKVMSSAGQTGWITITSEQLDKIEAVLTGETG